MRTQRRRSSLSMLTARFETIIEDNVKQDLRMARRSSLAGPSPNNSMNSTPPKRSMARRSSLADRLSLFESKIAENAKHSQGKDISFTNVVISTPFETRRPKVASTDERQTPSTVTTMTESTTVPSDMGNTSLSKMNRSIPCNLFVPYTENGDPIPTHSCAGSMTDTTESETGSDPVMTIQDADGKDAHQSYGNENCVAPSFLTQSEAGCMKNNPAEDCSSINEQGIEKCDDDDNESISDIYDAAKMLVDWDYQVSAIRHRAAKGRKGIVDTGSQISLKDRMKAFV